MALKNFLSLVRSKPLYIGKKLNYQLYANIIVGRDDKALLISKDSGIP